MYVKCFRILTLGGSDENAFLLLSHYLVSYLEIHHTPKHGRWLSMDEIELNVLLYI